jgi:hypothetical protein
MQTEGPGFIGCRGNDAPPVRFAPNYHRFTPKLGVVNLLYGDKEGIEVNVHDTAHHYSLTS